MQKNQQAFAIALKRALAKSKKIKELGIKPDMSIEEQDQLVLSLAKGKVTEGKTLKDFTKGQEWYVQDLVKFSALTAEERLDLEYSVAFPEVASPEEGLDALKAVM